MQLVVSSASFAAAFAVLAPANSNSVMASAVDAAYENKVEQVADKHIQSRSLGEECSFASFGLRGNEADTGILGCAEDFVCVEDVRSSLGGHCVSTESNMLQRRLVNTTCTTKCTGVDACYGLSQTFIDNNIADGACCGKNACKRVSGTTTIGKGSCVGDYSCYMAKDATIGSGSCTGDSIKSYDGSYGPYYGFSCAYFQGTVGDNSCEEYSACYQFATDGLKFNIGSNSCQGQTSCSYSANAAGTLSIGSGSCNGYYACYSMTSNVGNNSCNAMMACEANAGVIEDNVCNTEGSCASNTAAPTTVPTNPPTSKRPTNSPTTSAPATMIPTGVKSTKSNKGNKGNKSSKATENSTKAPTTATKAPTVDDTKSGKKNSKKN